MSSKTGSRIVAFSFLALTFASGHTRAATTTTTFGVSVTVQNTCAASASSMRFGTYTGAKLNAASTVSVTCTQSTPYNVGLSEGLAPGATVTNRKMIGPGLSLLGYSLKSGNGRMSNWGHTLGVDTVSGTGNGSVQMLPVVGEIPAGQNVQDGAYADTITVTVTY